MADSYAQLSKKSAVLIPAQKHQGACQATQSLNTIDMEDKVLSIAKLLKSTQMCHADHVADHKADIQLLSARIHTVEEAVGKQALNNTIASGPNALNIKALAERMALVEGRLMEGLSENQEVHIHNARFFQGIEDRLSKLEAQLSVGQKEQMADLQEALGPYVDRLVRARLDAFEDEVQARLLIATAGAMRHRVMAAGSSSCGGGCNDTSVPGAGSFDDRKGTMVDGAAPEGDDALRKEVEQLSESLKRLKAEQTSSNQSVTRLELLGVVEGLGVVAETHASMQLAVSQLKTICPEISRIVSLVKAGSESGSRYNSTLSKQSQALGLLVSHADTLIEVISGQLEQACGMSESIQSGMLRSSEAPQETTEDEGSRPALGFMLSSNLCKVIEETRDSLNSLSSGLKNSAGAGLKAVQPLSEVKLNENKRMPSQVPGGPLINGEGSGKENGSSMNAGSSKASVKIPLQSSGPPEENVPGSAEKRHARLRQMYSELKHLQ